MLHLETVAASTLELLKELLLKSLTYFDDAEMDIAPNVLDSTINWATVKSTITNEVKQLV